MSHVADSPQKSPFRPLFGAFYPHPANKSALRRLSQGRLSQAPLSGIDKRFEVPACASRRRRRDARRHLHRSFPVASAWPKLPCLAPIAELLKTERDPISTSGPSIFSISPNQAIVSDNSIRFSSPAAAQRLAIRSWPEVLNARGSRRAGRMPIRRNGCSLLALPDFPEFAQAVRHGVPGTLQVWCPRNSPTNRDLRNCCDPLLNHADLIRGPLAASLCIESACPSSCGTLRYCFCFAPARRSRVPCFSHRGAVAKW